MGVRHGSRRRGCGIPGAWLGCGLLPTLVSVAAQQKEAEPLIDKTMVAWVHVANLEQRGGSVLTIDDMSSHFDAIVFGEVTPGRWMPGSDFLRRTSRDQSDWPAETAGPQELLQLALVHAGNTVTLMRNGAVWANYTIDRPQPFGPESVVVFGRRHIESNDGATFVGAIAEARIYDRALSVEAVSALAPGDDSGPPPWALWSFEDGGPTDRTGRFGDCMLLGGARINRGCLVLDEAGGTMIAAGPGRFTGLVKRASTGGTIPELGATRKLRARLIGDRHRPLYHFVAPEGRCMPFDPNGALYWNGRYHLCYIFQDERGHCWGHASSADLVHWRFHEPALAPNPGDPDRGIFSGNAFVDRDGSAVLMYHGVEAGNCLAVSSDPFLDRWRKLESNPFVPIPREGDPDFGRYQSWDPHGWLDGDVYYAVFGGNPATLFRSADMRSWDCVGPLMAREMPGVDPDEDISCPDLFRLGDRHVLVCISHKRGCRYYVGEFDGERFVPELHRRMNWSGGTCFAPESLVDPKGRRIMWAWVLDRRSEDRVAATGWSGTMTLPRVLELGEDGTLRMRPAAELETLRRNPRVLRNVSLAAGQETAVDGIAGTSLDLKVEFTGAAAAGCGLKLLCSPDGAEQTVVFWDPENGRLGIDFGQSSLDSSIKHRVYCMHGGDNPEATVQTAPFELAPGEPLRLRVLIDRSIIEVFANGRQCLTQRVYPTRTDSVGIALFAAAAGNGVRVPCLRAWDMAPANPW